MRLLRRALFRATLSAVAVGCLTAASILLTQPWLLHAA